MTLRSRLAWAFVAMLVVPGFILMLLGLIFRLWWDPNDRDSWSGGSDIDLYRTMETVNTLLIDEPDSLLSPLGFTQLSTALQPGFEVAVFIGQTMVQGSADYFDSTTKGLHGHRPYSWEFRLADGSKARLDLVWSRKGFFQLWGPWVIGTMVTSIVVLILTNGVLTWLLGRSIVRPLAALEKAVQNLSNGDLDTRISHRGSEEFTDLATALDTLRTRLKNSLEERHALEEERRVWVASVSHDIRTPLSVIRAYAEALHQGQPRALEKQGRYHGVILERALHMERLVDDLFQWARWDWNEPKLHLQTLDLRGELEKAQAIWIINWPDLNIQVHFPPGDLAIKADPMGFRRIIDNLARNAHQHGGPSCTFSIDSWLSSENTVSMNFSNNGPSIPQEHLPLIFERFFRGDPARNAMLGGGGLGLTIALSLATAMDGKLSVSNLEHGGVTFCLTLPGSLQQVGS